MRGRETNTEGMLMGLDKRQIIMDYLGGKCSCLGDNCCHTGECPIIDPRCLQLDHINSDGPADKLRLGSGSGLINYYFGHLEEAKSNLQILCANCNWVKRTVKEETGSRPTTLSWKEREIANRISVLPDYAKLVDEFESLSNIAAETPENVIDRLREWDITCTETYPMSFYLAKGWFKQSCYSDSESGLIGFINEKMHLLDFIVCQHLSDSFTSRSTTPSIPNMDK
jgi:hypothetical protein